LLLAFAEGLLSLAAFYRAYRAHGCSSCPSKRAHQNVPIKTILLIVLAENILAFYLGLHAVEF